MYEKGFWAMPKEIMSIKGLSPEARLVYAILFTRTNGENLAWPGQVYIANIIGCSVRSVQRYINELVDNHLVTVHRMGLKRTNRYSLIRQDVVSRCDSGVVSRPDKMSHHIVRDPLVRKEKKEKRGDVSKLSTILGNKYGPLMFS